MSGKSRGPALAQKRIAQFRFGSAPAAMIARASLLKRRRCLTQQNG
jgi:hypothetical protein